MQFSDFAECTALKARHYWLSCPALFVGSSRYANIQAKICKKKDVLEPLIWFDFHFKEGTISGLSCVAAAWAEKFELNWEMVADGERSFTFLQCRLEGGAAKC